MSGTIAYFSAGLRRLLPEIRMLTGFEPRFSLFSAVGADAVAGWGHKPTAARARAAARRAALPYIAFEDGFLRSLKPGPGQRPSSLIMDRTGIYYDARQPSDIEILLETGEFSAAETSRASGLLGLIARHRLSKYNHGAEGTPAIALAPGQKLVILADQTFGDQSVAGAMADASTFRRMAEAAIAENPGALVAARLHPETAGGTKPGYLRSIARSLGLVVIAEPLSPWCLFDRAPHVYTVSSQFGFDALLAGCTVTCFGVPFYAGWGLTDDRAACPRRTRRRSPADLAAAVYLRYCRYFDCWRRVPVEPETAIDQLAFLRRTYLGNARRAVCYRIPRWKRRAVSVLLDGPDGPPRFTRRLGRAIRLARQGGGAVTAWGITAVRLRPRLAAMGLPCIAIEDGFLRSVGLGAAFVAPLSLVCDATGLYFDPTAPSDIETALAHDDIGPEECARAAALRRAIVALHLTKYNVGDAAWRPPDIPAGRQVILVPGQVADDWAVMLGRPPDFPAGANVNGVLLARVRAANPDAFVIFKPHPDVEQLSRAGALTGGHEERLADVIARNVPLDHLFPLARRVETYSSLAGFEALLRGIPVTAHGMPFYAGWGLTADMIAAPRRGRRRSLDEISAISFFRYARYWDPAAGLPCPAEVIVDRLARERAAGRGSGSMLGVAAGRAVILARRMRKMWGGSTGEQ